MGVYFGSDDRLLRFVFAARSDDSHPKATASSREEILDIGWYTMDNLPRPIPDLAVQMIRQACSMEPTRLETIKDDSVLLLQ